MCPSADMPSVRPLQEAEAPVGLTVPPASSRSALVVSHHLDGLLRTMGRGFIAPRSQPGVRRVSGLAAFSAARGRRRWAGTFPATRFTPFEEFPSSAAVPHHCGRCLRAVTVHRPIVGMGRSRSPRSPASDRGRARNPPTWLPRETALAPEGDSRWDAGRAFDAVMLRSAEADPHVTDAQLTATGRNRELESRRIASWRAMPKQRGAGRDRTTDGVGHDPASCGVAWGRLATRRWSFDPPAAEAAGRCAAPRRSHRGEAGERARRSPRSGQLQGLAPLTSPCRHIAVASEMTLDPSMGFIPLQGPSSPVPAW